MRRQVRESIVHLRIAKANRQSTIHMLWQQFWGLFFLATTIGFLILPSTVELGQWKFVYYQWFAFSVIGLLATWLWIWRPAVQGVRTWLAGHKRRNKDGAAPKAG